jgi:hypothetical protein
VQKSRFKQLGHSTAIINKVQNTLDGGLRVTLDMTAQDIDLVKTLLDLAVNKGTVLVQFLSDGQES